MKVPFNWPSISQEELGYIERAAANLRLSGNGEFTKRCQGWLEARVGCAKALLTHSGTGALEMAALLAEIAPGDEVIMPSFTFASTANAFVLRGGVPVFVDIEPQSLNIDVAAVAAAITERTRAIVPVHYAGMGCDMDGIMRIAAAARVLVIEDAAQGLLATHNSKPLGSFGAAAAVSFHETKNIISGEGGALLINHPEWLERAEIIWEKGTNRAAFSRGEVDKYTWCDIGSSFLPSEISAAFLWGQLERADAITARRIALWETYHHAFAELEARELLRRPIVPASAGKNSHIYYVLLPTAASLDHAIAELRRAGVDAVRHYVPLHSAPAGRRFGRTSGDLHVTNDLSARLLRLPLWVGMTEEHTAAVVDAVWRATTPNGRKG